MFIEFQGNPEISHTVAETSTISKRQEKLKCFVALYGCKQHTANGQWLGLNTGLYTQQAK